MAPQIPWRKLKVLAVFRALAKRCARGHLQSWVSLQLGNLVPHKVAQIKYKFLCF
jgi:hypothetical protein